MEIADSVHNFKGGGAVVHMGFDARQTISRVQSINHMPLRQAVAGNVVVIDNH